MNADELDRLVDGVREEVHARADAGGRVRDFAAMIARARAIAPQAVSQDDVAEASRFAAVVTLRATRTPARSEVKQKKSSRGLIAVAAAVLLAVGLAGMVRLARQDVASPSAHALPLVGPGAPAQVPATAPPEEATPRGGVRVPRDMVEEPAVEALAGVREAMDGETGDSGVREDMREGTGDPGVREDMRGGSGDSGVREDIRGGSGAPGVREDMRGGTGDSGVREDMRGGSGAPGVREDMRGGTGDPGVREDMRGGAGDSGVREDAREPGVREDMRGETGAVRRPKRAARADAATGEALDRAAREAWRRGDLEEARALLSALVLSDAEASRIELAYGDLFVLARRSHEPQELARLWRAYLERFPRGLYAEDARAGLCRRADGEARRACWQLYSETWPEGAHADEAREGL